MEKKTMYALVWCYEGYDDNTPIGSAVAVSEDKEKLYAELAECIAEDTREPDEENEEDEWSDNCNFKVIREMKDDVLLQHSVNTDLYVHYTIRSVSVL